MNETGKDWYDYPQSYNVNTLNDGIKECLDLLKRENRYTESYIYRKLMIMFNEDENVVRSFALRLLNHYLGD